MRAQDLRKIWEKLLDVRKRSFPIRFTASVIISVVGFLLTLYFYQHTSFYFTSFIVLSTILATLFSGLVFGISVAIIFTLVADYNFIPPIGSILNTNTAIAHFFIVVILAIFVAILSSNFSSAFQNILFAKQEAEKAKQEAEKTSDLMEKTLALVSHDIRNPLSSIRLGAQLVLRNPHLSENHRSILDKMLASLERVDSMIQSLLDVARIRAGKLLHLDFQACNLSDEIRLMLDDMTLLGLTNVNYTSDSPLWGNWGLNGIHRILENLINNAKKYGTPNSSIEIRTFKKGDFAILTVHNDGPHIPLEQQSVLFNSFQRTINSETSTTRGWGLGLSLVKGFAEAHGGVVKVESSKFEGTTFTVELPLRQKNGSPMILQK